MLSRFRVLGLFATLKSLLCLAILSLWLLKLVKSGVSGTVLTFNLCSFWVGPHFYNMDAVIFSSVAILVTN